MSAQGPRASLRRVFRLPSTDARVRSEVDDELRFHLEGRVEELMAQGFDRESATAEARRRFGNVDEYRNEATAIDTRIVHRRRSMRFLDAIRRELRYAMRTLGRDRGFSFTAVTTLALALGAATAIFTILDAVVLRPLPYPNADRLVELTSPVPKFQGDTLWGLARHQMFYYLDNSRVVENIGLYQPAARSVRGANGEAAERVSALLVSASLFRVLGMRPEIGRLLDWKDNTERIPLVVVLGHGYWQRRFGGDPAILGKVIDVDGFPVTVVGVVPPAAQLPGQRTDMWLPARIDRAMSAQNNHTWNAIGIVRPGFTAKDAERDLAPLVARLPELFPNAEPPQFVKNTGFRTQVRPLRDVVVGETLTRGLWILFGSVLLVLLIATANLSNLIMVRAEARRRETAVRTALGAGRVHHAAQSLAEGLVIAVIAGALAVLLAWAGTKLLLAHAPGDLPRLDEVQLRWTGVAFAAGGALLVALFLGVIPLLGRPPLDVSLLREGGRGMTSSRRRHAIRGALVVAQVAVSLVLLTGAGLMLRSFQQLRAVRPGFDPTGVLTMNVSLPAGQYAKSYEATSAFYERLAERIGGMPGVTAVGFSEKIPLANGNLCTGVAIEGTAGEIRGDCPPTALVSPGYFEAMGIRVDGQSLTWSDMNQHGGQMVVSRAFAQRVWKDRPAIGRGLRYFGNEPPWYRVSGVADDVLGDGLDQPAVAIVYFPMLRIPGADLWGPPTFMNLVVRTSGGDPLRLAAPISRAVAELDAGAAVSNAQTMEDVVARSMSRRTFTMLLLAVAAAIALFLSVVGIYGVISYVTGQRRSEIAIRRALGAQVREVTAMVLKQSLRLAALGVVLGIAMSLGTMRVLRSLLFGVSPNDPVLIAGAALVLLTVALLAGWIPARRAARVDPSDAFRAA